MVIGCSAGGLDALLKFFRNVPADCGLAYVVVQHLDPVHDSTLPESIRRITPSPVRVAVNRMMVKPDTVYLIPPNKELSVQRGLLLLRDASRASDLRPVVDFLLRSLAEEAWESAIGVVLSGMGSDGVLGLRAHGGGRTDRIVRQSGPPHGPTDPAELCSGRRPGQWRRRHPPYLRTHRQVSRAGRRQGQRQYPRHGSGGFAPGTDRGRSNRAAPAPADPSQRAAGRHQRRDAIRQRHRAGTRPPEPPRGRVLVVFNDVPARSSRKERKAAASDEQETLELELQQTREALCLAHEEIRTSVEECKSANEELSPSKEELQSRNDELQAVNAQLRLKVDELTRIQNDMCNLLISTEIATVFLDNDLKLRRFTGEASPLLELVDTDVGRSLSDIVSDIDYLQIWEDATEVLRTLVYRERRLERHDGRWYRVRIMPYRTLENVIDGVVITFMSLTEIKQMDSELRNKASAADQPSGSE